MTSQLKKTLSVLSLAFLSSVSVHAAPDKDGTEVYLAAMGSRELTHSQDAPLLLEVNIFNELKAVTIGSSGQPLAGSVRFEVKDAAGKMVSLAIRALAESAELKGPIALPKERAGLYFGADPQALSVLQEGAYTLQAFFQDASSAPVKLTLRRSAPRLDDPEGLFYRQDRQWDALLAHADRMVQKDANVIAGHIYRGDALAGLGRGRDALVPYGKALELHKAQYQGKALVEAPIYILDRIKAIVEQQ